MSLSGLFTTETFFQWTQTLVSSLYVALGDSFASSGQVGRSTRLARAGAEAARVGMKSLLRTG